MLDSTHYADIKCWAACPVCIQCETKPLTLCFQLLSSSDPGEAVCRHFVGDLMEALGLAISGFRDAGLGLEVAC